MGNKREDLELLIEYLRGQLGPEDQALMEKRIADDPVLGEMIRFLSDLRSEIGSADWKEMKHPSHTLFERLLKDIKYRKRDASGTQGVTIFDSQLLPLPEGVRSAAVDTRRIKYLIGEAQLEISLYPVSPSSFEVIGLLTGYDTGEVLDVELSGKKVKLSARANRFSLFRYPQVSAGVYELSIRDGEKLVGRVNLEL